jgi:hypothetical protein
MPLPTILQSLDHPQLFGPFFKGDSWTAWRAFLGALFGLPLDDDALATYRRLTGRSKAPTKAFTEAALIVGRRGGKSRVLATIAVFLAHFRDYTPHLAPGEVATIMIIAADRKQERSIFQFVSGLLHDVPALSQMIDTEADDQILLTNRVRIEIGTASFRVTRGYSFAAVLADEIAFWRTDEASANPDTEILRALRPGMASIPGSILMLASSPYAKKGELYQSYRKHYGKDDARVLIWKADTATMNPRIPPDIIAEAYESDPEAAKAEYGAEFRDDLADFVTREAVDAVTMWGRHELPPIAGATYRAFADPSGGSIDAMTVAVGHLHENGDVGVLDAVLEIRAPFNPEEATAKCAELLKRYRVTRVIGDRYAGEWPPTEFRKHGIEFEQSAKPKSDLYHDLLPLLNAGRIELLDHQRLSAQLVGLERRVSRSGRDSIDHAPGGHDDIINAVAGVLTNVDLDRRPALVKQSDLTVADLPVPLPKRAPLVYAVLMIGADGMAASAFFATRIGNYPGQAPLTLCDFNVAPLSGTTVADLIARLTELGGRIDDANPYQPRLVGGLIDADDIAIWVPENLVPQIRRHGVPAASFPPEMITAPTIIALAASSYVAEGNVKIAAPASAKAATMPLKAALAYRVGEAIDVDTLRWALLTGIAIGMPK